jgi:hypothetical protein
LRICAKFAAQLLCNLAKSDPQNRMLADFDALLAVTKDKRFVTSRHSLQALWKVGAAGEEQKALLLDALQTRYYVSKPYLFERIYVLNSEAFLLVLIFMGSIGGL